MPSYGGSPYKRVKGALSTVSGKTVTVEPVIDAENTCDVQAFEVWYWSEEGSFVSETMYYNASEVAVGEPRLIVSLGSFQSLSQAYVMSVEKESVKAGLLHEKEDLLARCRVGYYKELQHLREILEMARQNMMMGRGALDEANLKRRLAFEKYVKETEVYYFNICDYLEPDLKEIMKEACKQFHRDLMKEIFELRERLALHEGGDGDDFIERLLMMLINKGISTSRILRILSNLAAGMDDAREYYATMREILGIGGRGDDNSKPREPKRGGGEVDDGPVSPTGGRRLQRDPDDSGRGREANGDGGKGPIDTSDKDKALAAALKENERLKAELDALRKKFRQLELDSQAEINKLKRELEAALKAAEDARNANRGGGGDTGGGGGGGSGVREVVREVGGEKQVIREREVIREGDDEDLLRRLRELERRLREAQALIESLTGQPADEVLGPTDNSPAAAAGAAGGRERKDPGTSGGAGDYGEGFSRSATSRSPKGLGGKSGLVDRDIGDVSRTGNYSIMTGKPIAVVEAELSLERRRRLDLENEKRRLVGEVQDLQVARDDLALKLRDQEDALEDATNRLDTLVNRDEPPISVLDNVAIFCRWLSRKYGNLATGYRAVDGHRNGTLSYHEFCNGLIDVGWIKIIGRQLFDVIDPENKGHITLDMLLEAYRKYVEGHPDDHDAAERMKAAIREQQEMDKDERRLEIAINRLKKLEAEKVMLEEEVGVLRKRIARSAGNERAVSDEKDKLKGLERRAETFKTGYENLKLERDELASKMTAAMWKCREAHILQVKFKREADLKTEQYARLNKKFELFKGLYKRGKAAAMEQPHFGAQTQPAGFGGKWNASGKSTLEGPMALTSGTLSLRLASGDDPSASAAVTDPNAAEDTDAGACSSPSNVLASAVLESALMDAGGEARVSGTPLAACRPEAGVLYCPRCNAKLLLDNEPLAAAAPGAGGMTEAEILADEPPIVHEHTVSPEDLVNRLTDEDLLAGTAFGNTTEKNEVFASADFASGITGHSLGGTGGASQGGQKLLPYRTRIAARLEAGRKPRYELLFLDSVDRMRAQTTPIIGDGGFADVHSASTAVLSRESEDLIRHAQEIRMLWREAVPIDQALPVSEEAERMRFTSTATALGSQRLPSGAVTVGRVPQRTVTPFEETASPLMGTSIRDPMSSSAGFHDHSRTEERKKAIMEEYNKRSRHRAASPEHDGSIRPPLCIQGTTQQLPPQQSQMLLGEGSLASPSMQLPVPPSVGDSNDLVVGSAGPQSPSLLHSASGPIPVGPVGSGAAAAVAAAQQQLQRTRGRPSASSLRRGSNSGQAPEPLGSGLPVAVGTSGGLGNARLQRSANRRTPTQLPQLSPSPPPMETRIPGDGSSALRASRSMPGLERGAVVSTPPLAAFQVAPPGSGGSAGLGSTGSLASRARTATGQPGPRRLVGAEEYPPSTAHSRDSPFEESSLQVMGPGAAAAMRAGVPGRPPPQRQQMRLGAARAVPNQNARMQELAAGAFELGSHVKRHAAADLSAPVVIQATSLS
eukprot:TRINITY_DN14414_c0_g3_i1.p1 TRINITY_DN14414_c0_g3~~TRINITY_DN14414_c0_g3_i1.p1  ORF type:complete len:1551 (-),score=362.06 TRINITY_DN14414_c0_g3_i1:28-4617(-)